MTKKRNLINKTYTETYGSRWGNWRIINIERDSQNGDDIHIHIKDKDGCVYKGIITSLEEISCDDSADYCFCGYERDPNDDEDWSIHIKECPNYHYKMKVKNNEE